MRGHVRDFKYLREPSGVGRLGVICAASVPQCQFRRVELPRSTGYAALAANDPDAGARGHKGDVESGVSRSIETQNARSGLFEPPLRVGGMEAGDRNT